MGVIVLTTEPMENDSATEYENRGVEIAGIETKEPTRRLFRSIGVATSSSLEKIEP